MNHSADVTDESERSDVVSVVSVLDGTSDERGDRARRDSARDRALLSSMGSGAVVRVLSALLSMGYFAVSVRALTQVQFGAMAAIATFTGLMAFADFGVGGGLMTRLAVAHGRDDHVGARNVVSSAWSAMLGLGVLAAGIGAVLSQVLPWHRILGMPSGSEGEARSAFLAFALCAGLAVPANIGQRVLIASQRGTAANLWLLAGTAATLGFIGLAAAADAPLWCFVAVLVGAPMVVAATQSVWVFFFAYRELRPQFGLVNRESLWSLGQVSSLFFILNVAVTFAYQCDMLIVASTLGAATAAVFAVGLRMFGALTGVLSGSSQQLWTSMAEALSRGDLSWVRTRFIRALLLTGGVSVAGCSVLVLFGQPIARAWVGSNLVPSIWLLTAFAVWTVYSIAMTQVAYLLNAAQIIGPQIVMALSMTLANLILSIYFTHRFGLVGPLLGSLVAHVAFSGVPSILYVRRLLAQGRPEVGVSV